jgi:hypothetical protein
MNMEVLSALANPTLEPVGCRAGMCSTSFYTDEEAVQASNIALHLQW